MERRTIDAYLASLPTRARRHLELEYVGGAANVWCALLPWLVPLLFTCASGLWLLDTEWTLAAVVLTGAAIFVAGPLVAFRVVAAVEKSVLRRSLSRLPDGRLPACPACRYDLRGAPSERCPECGCPVRIGA